MQGAGNSVTIQIGGQDDIYGDVRWGPEQTYIIGTDFKTDHLAEGRYITFKLKSSTDLWRLDSLDFDIEMLGDR